MIEIRNLKKSYGDKIVLSGISLDIYPGLKAGLIGRNGCGKSTLLKIIAGLEGCDGGSITKKRSMVIGYLPQDDPQGEGTVLMDEVSSEIKALRDEMESLMERMEDAPQDEVFSLLNDYQAISEKFESLGGYSFESIARSVLGGLGFSEADYMRPIATFSGGERAKVKLAKILLSQPDLLLLDEPTNHLDLRATEWFEDYLVKYKKGLVLVSHDRFLLDGVVETIWEIEDQKLTEYPGNYSSYMEEKARRLEKAWASYWDNQDEIKRIKEEIARRKSRAMRIEKETIHFHYRKKAAKVARSAKAAETKLKKLPRVERPRYHEDVHLRLDLNVRSGNVVCEVKDLSKRFGDSVLFSGTNFTIFWGEKVALIGNNGSGKTTLLHLLLGLDEPTEGEVTRGANIKVGYIAQDRTDLDPNRTIFEEIDSAGANLTNYEVRSIAARFLFKEDDVERKVGTLSGGEKTRVTLAKLMAAGANFLVLDEPTNHLDIPSIEILESILQSYPGTILFVSHDRGIISALAEKIIEIDKGEVKVYHGDYEYYRSQMENHS
jgi:ATP-binding cassette subfamily F protein 3